MGFGCTFDDAECYCSQSEFRRGLSDCGIEACGDDSDILAFAEVYCSCKFVLVATLCFGLFC